MSVSTFRGTHGLASIMSRLSTAAATTTRHSVRIGATVTQTSSTRGTDYQVYVVTNENGSLDPLRNDILAVWRSDLDQTLTSLGQTDPSDYAVETARAICRQRQGLDKKYDAPLDISKMSDEELTRFVALEDKAGAGHSFVQ